MTDETFDDQTQYQVGYKKPPKHTQFAPGRSGNPRGRPKGRKSVEQIVYEQIYRNAGVKIDGSTTQVPALEAALMRLVQLTLQSPPTKTIDILKFLLSYLPEDSEPTIAESDFTVFTDNELKVFGMLTEKMMGRRPREFDVLSAVREGGEVHNRDLSEGVSCETEEWIANEQNG